LPSLTTQSISTHHPSFHSLLSFYSTTFNMQFQLPTLALGLLATLTAAAPADLEARQGQGGYFAASGYKYTGGGCTTQAVAGADPIFGYGGYCQLLNRFPDASTTPVTSYKLAAGLKEGCTGEWYFPVHQIKALGRY
jgi:hypothetical protein